MLLDGLAEQITEDIYGVLRNADLAAGRTSPQIEDMAAFYSGGIVNMLRRSLRHGKKLEEDTFAASVEAVLSCNLWE